MSKFAQSLKMKARRGSAALQRLRRKKRPQASAQKGRFLAFKTQTELVRLRKVLDKHVDRKLLDALDMDRKHFDEVMKELIMRCRNQRKTVAQLVGTFFEIVGAEHEEVMNIRKAIVDNNLESALQSAFKVRGVFMNGAGDIQSGFALTDYMTLFDWKDGGKVAGRVLADFEARKVQFGRRNINDVMLKRLRTKLNPARIEEIYDLNIKGSLYCDRAVRLKLTDGRSLILVSEEYKAPKSGGIKGQQAVRNDRLFKEGLDPSTLLEYKMNGKAHSIKLGTVLLNLDTVGADQFGVKAARDTDLEHHLIKVNRDVQDRKLKFGESLTIGSDAHSIFYYLKLNFPSGSVRAMVEDVFGIL